MISIFVFIHILMGGVTVGQWGQLAPTEMRLWGQNYVIAPTELRRARSARYK